MSEPVRSEPALSEPILSGLAELQARFGTALLDGSDNPTPLFRGDPERVARRFALYRGNLTANWDRALGNAYPVMRQLLGDDFFRALARALGRAEGSACGDLNRFGAGLAEFLTGFEPTAAYPYLPDMARLEWALHRAHQAPDVPALDATRLAGLTPAELEALTLELSPGCALVASPFDIPALWQAHQGGGGPWPQPLERPSWALVSRPAWRAEVLVLGPGEHAALVAIAQGAGLGQALEAGAAAADFDPGECLPRWLAARAFAAHPPIGTHSQRIPT